MTVSIGIVAHTTRRALAEQLQARVNADIISIDDGTLKCGGNHQQVWTELADTTSDWALVLEDDAQPVVNFTGQLHRALDACPTNVCSLYLGATRPPQYQTAIADALAKADANQACWITTPLVLHAVALAVRTALIPSMLNHLHTRNYLPIDEAQSSWARKTGQLVAYSVPSLVQHPDVLPTLVRHRDGAPRPTGTRTAHRVGTRRTWTSDTVPL